MRILVHHAFISWARLYLDRNHVIVYYAMNLTKAMEIARQNRFNKIYLIWRSQDIGWYQNIKIPENFKINYTSGRMGVFRKLT